MPSIGSTIQRRLPPPRRAELLAEHAVVRPLVREPAARIAASTARSASVTGVRSGFVSTTRSLRAEAAERDRVGRVGEREGECEVGAHPSPDPTIATGYFEEATSRNFGFATVIAIGADQVICCFCSCVWLRPRTR